MAGRYSDTGASALTWEQLPIFPAPDQNEGQQRRPCQPLLVPQTSTASVQIDDADDELLTPKRTMISAHEAPPIRTRAVHSIWAAADAIAQNRRVRLGAIGKDDEPAPKVEVRREQGVTRVSGGQYPANRWTAEREEQERARRARQKPPRPPKGAKTRGAKLLEMIGGDDE